MLSWLESVGKFLCSVCVSVCAVHEYLSAKLDCFTLWKVCSTTLGNYWWFLTSLITFLQFLYVSRMLWSGRGRRRQRSLKHNRGSVTHLMVISHCSATLGPDGWGTHFRDRHTAVVLNIFCDVSFSNWDSGCCGKKWLSLLLRTHRKIFQMLPWPDCSAFQCLR